MSLLGKRIFMMGTAVAVVAAMSGCAAPAANPAGGDNSAPSSSTAEKLVFKVGVHPCASDCGFLLMAQEKGFFDKYGVDVEYVDLKSAAQSLPALASGEVDAIEESPGGFFIASEKGDFDASIIGSTMEGMPYAVYAKKEFSSLKDLEGKNLAISSPTGLPALVAQLILEDAGVDYSKMTLVNGGGNADRYKAVVAGTADAASSPADYVPQAEKDGVKVLALSHDVVPNYPRYMIIANNDALKKNDAATRYLAAMIEGVRYAYAHPDEAKALAAKMMKTTADDPIVTYMYDLIVKDQLFDKDQGISQKKLDFQEKVLRDVGQLTKPVPMDKLVDDSFQKAALKMVKDKS